MSTIPGQATQAAMDWAGLRRQMPVAQRWAYFDHAAVSPLPEPTRVRLTAWAEEASQNGDIFWPKWAQQVEGLRQQAARLVHAHADEIALIHSTTEGINFVAEGFPWEPGDNVVFPGDEFPTNQYPWMALAQRGVEVRRIPAEEGVASLDRIAAACDRRTRVVAVSWVSYSNGWRHDLAQLAEIVHRCGALLFLDAIQGLGVFPLDVSETPIDFLAADGHKWLLGPEGAGVFFARREHLSLLRPVGIGWNSVAHCYDFNHIELTLKDSAARYEGGSQSMVGLLALQASLELLGQFGPAALGERITQITDLACERLCQIGAVLHSRRCEGHKSGIVSFSFPGRDPQALRQQCLDQGVALSCRAGRLRISPHAYNNNDDLERLIAALK
ncbi:MAG: aminotransferase class V-fold PLP-dependent enzyme [Thermoguttaceae bacterium]